MQYSTHLKRSSNRCALIALSIVGACLTTAEDAKAAAAYWRCSLERVTVISNSSAARCERLLRATLRHEQVLLELLGWEPDTSLLPLTLYSLTRADAQRVMFTEGQLAEQKKARRTVHSKYLPGSDLNIAAIIDAGGDESLQSALFLYGQSLLADGPTRSYPMWFQLGVASLLNGAVIRPDGTVLLNRKPTFVAVVEDDQRAGGRLNLAALLDAEPRELTPADFNKMAHRAHVWAQFGLLTAEERRSQYRELALLMRQGTPAEEAVPAAFGISLDALTEEFETSAWRKDASYRLVSPGASPNVSPAVPLDAPDVNVQLGLLAARVAEYPDLD